MKRAQITLFTILIAVVLWYLLGGNQPKHTSREIPDSTNEAISSVSPPEPVPTTAPAALPETSQAPAPPNAPTTLPADSSSASAQLKPLTEQEVTERRSAVKATLAGLYTAQAAYFAEYNRYSPDLGHIGYLPSEGTIKAQFGFLETHSPTGGLNPNEDPTRSSSDAFIGLRDDDGEPVYQYDAYSRQASLASGAQYCIDRCAVRDDRFELISAFNLDSDETLDVWIIDHRKNIRHVVDDLKQ